MDGQNTPPDGAAARGPVGAPPRWVPGRQHYGWVVVIIGLLVTMCVLGIGRFAFGMLLPSMAKGLSLTYAQMGTISTTNFIGYLVGAMVSGPLSHRYGPRRVIVTTLVATCLSLTAVATSSGFWPVLLLFTITGLSSGAGNVANMGLIARWFLKSLRGRATGVVVTGSGYAIMVTGIAVPRINEAHPDDGWRIGWLLLAATVAVVTVLAALLLRNHPSEVGADPVGHTHRPPKPYVPLSPAELRRATVHLGLIYAAFGFSYVIYVTFIVTTLVHERGFSETTAGWFWFVVGLLSTASGPVFGYLSDQAGRGIGFAAVSLLHALSFAFVGFGLPTPFLYASIGLFGLAAWSIPGIMGAAAADYMGPDRAIRGLGILTVWFGVGQALGPFTAGLLAERTGGFASSYVMATVASLAGLALALTLRPPHATST